MSKIIVIVMDKSLISKNYFYFPWEIQKDSCLKNDNIDELFLRDRKRKLLSRLDFAPFRHYEAVIDTDDWR